MRGAHGLEIETVGFGRLTSSSVDFGSTLNSILAEIYACLLIILWDRSSPVSELRQSSLDM